MGSGFRLLHVAAFFVSRKTETYERKTPIAIDRIPLNKQVHSKQVHIRIAATFSHMLENTS